MFSTLIYGSFINMFDQAIRSEVDLYGCYRHDFKTSPRNYEFIELKLGKFVLLKQSTPLLEKIEIYSYNLFNYGQIHTSWLRIKKNKWFCKNSLNPNKSDRKTSKRSNWQSRWNKNKQNIENKVQDLKNRERYINILFKKLHELDPKANPIQKRQVEIPSFELADPFVDLKPTTDPSCIAYETYETAKRTLKNYVKSSFFKEFKAKIGVDKQGKFYILNENPTLIESVTFYALWLLGRIKTDWNSVEKWQNFYKAQVLPNKEAFYDVLSKQNSHIEGLDNKIKELDTEINNLQENLNSKIPKPNCCENLPKNFRVHPKMLSFHCTLTNSTSIQELEDFLAQNSDCNLKTQGKNGSHLLTIAAYRGNVPLIEFIVEKGGKELLSLGDRYKRTPLINAIESEEPNQEKTHLAVKKLIELGADVNLANDQYHTPLYLAATAEKKDPKVIKALLKDGARAYPCLPMDAQLFVDDIEREIQSKIEASRQARRLIWIGHLKNTPEESNLAKLPKDIVKQLCHFIYPNRESYFES